MCDNENFELMDKCLKYFLMSNAFFKTHRKGRIKELIKIGFQRDSLGAYKAD